jgi:hypothetical protein
MRDIQPPSLAGLRVCQACYPSSFCLPRSVCLSSCLPACVRVCTSGALLVCSSVCLSVCLRSGRQRRKTRDEGKLVGKKRQLHRLAWQVTPCEFSSLGLPVPPLLPSIPPPTAFWHFATDGRRGRRVRPAVSGRP